MENNLCELKNELKELKAEKSKIEERIFLLQREIEHIEEAPIGHA